MGSNVSTSSNVRKETKTNNNNNNNKPSQTRGQVTAVANRNYKSSNEDQTNVIIEIIKPVSFLNHSTKNINRVIPFHSTAAWREYFQVSKNSDKLIVIFFWAKWCGFCRYMSPIIDDLATQYTDVEIHKIDVDELFEISKEYRVTTMPTFLYMKRGKEVDKAIGTVHQEISTKIMKHRA